MLFTEISFKVNRFLKTVKQKEGEKSLDCIRTEYPSCPAAQRTNTSSPGGGNTYISDTDVG